MRKKNRSLKVITLVLLSLLTMMLVGCSGTLGGEPDRPGGAEDFTYSGTTSITITGYTGTARNVSIPARIDGKPVTAIGGIAFWNKQLTSVSIPNSVASIGEGVFADNQLTSVSIPNSVTSIGEWAFLRNQLTSVTIPSSVTSIEKLTFQNNQLASITIPNSVTSIGAQAFYHNQLTSVTIPNSVTRIGYYAFSENQLTSITIGANVTLQSSSFPGGFGDAYNNGGKLAGTYTRPDASSSTWTRH